MLFHKKLWICQEIFIWEDFNLEIPATILTHFMGDSFENEKVYLFRNKNYDKNAPAHFHIALKTTQDEYLVLSMITSQVEKKIKYYSLTNKSLVDSVLIINSDDIDILEKESCIDCNEPIYSTKEEIESIALDLEYIEAKIDKNLKNKIIKAIKSSAKVRDEIKNSLGKI